MSARTKRDMTRAASAKSPLSPKTSARGAKSPTPKPLVAEERSTSVVWAGHGLTAQKSMKSLATTEVTTTTTTTTKTGAVAAATSLSLKDVGLLHAVFSKNENKTTNTLSTAALKACLMQLVADNKMNKDATSTIVTEAGGADLTFSEFVKLVTSSSIRLRNLDTLKENFDTFPLNNDLRFAVDVFESTCQPCVAAGSLKEEALAQKLKLARATSRDGTIGFSEFFMICSSADFKGVYSQLRIGATATSGNATREPTQALQTATATATTTTTASNSQTSDMPDFLRQLTMKSFTTNTATAALPARTPAHVQPVESALENSDTGGSFKLPEFLSNPRTSGDSDGANSYLTRYFSNRQVPQNTDDYAETLQTTVEEQRIQLQTQTDKSEELQLKNDRLFKQLGQLKQELETQKQRYFKLESEYQQLRTSTFSAEDFRQLQMELNTCRQNCAQKDHELASIKLSLESFDKEVVGKYKRDEQMFKKKIQQLQQAVEDAQGEKRPLEQRIRALEDEKLKFEGERRQFESVVRTTVATKEQAENTVRQMASRLEMIRSSEERLQAQVKQLKAEVDARADEVNMEMQQKVATASEQNRTHLMNIRHLSCEVQVLRRFKDEHSTLWNQNAENYAQFGKAVWEELQQSADPMQMDAGNLILRKQMRDQSVSDLSDLEQRVRAVRELLEGSLRDPTKRSNKASLLSLEGVGTFRMPKPSASHQALQIEEEAPLPEPFHPVDMTLGELRLLFNKYAMVYGGKMWGRISYDGLQAMCLDLSVPVERATMMVTKDPIIFGDCVEVFLDERRTYAGELTIDDLKYHFERYDLNKNNKIELDELAEVYSAAVGYPVSREFVLNQMQKGDMNDDLEVDFDEYVEMMCTVQEVQPINRLSNDELFVADNHVVARASVESADFVEDAHVSTDFSEHQDVDGNTVVQQRTTTTRTVATTSNLFYSWASLQDDSTVEPVLEELTSPAGHNPNRPRVKRKVKVGEQRGHVTRQESAGSMGQMDAHFMAMSQHLE